MKVADLVLKPGTNWEKSTRSVSGNCVQFAELANGMIGVRDSKDPDGDALVFTRSEIDAMISGVRGGQFARFGTQHE